MSAFKQICYLNQTYLWDDSALFAFHDQILSIYNCPAVMLIFSLLLPCLWYDMQSFGE